MDMTFAKIAEKLAKKENEYSERMSKATTTAGKNTARRMMERVKARKDALVEENRMMSQPVQGYGVPQFGGGGDNIVGGIDISPWATNPKHEENVRRIYERIKKEWVEGYSDPKVVENTIRKLAPGSEISGESIINTATKYGVDPALIIAIAHEDSSLGTKGKGVRTKNPGNWGNDDTGKTTSFDTWEAGIDKIGEQLSRYRDGKAGAMNTSANPDSRWAPIPALPPAASNTTSTSRPASTVSSGNPPSASAQNPSRNFDNLAESIDPSMVLGPGERSQWDVLGKGLDQARDWWGRNKPEIFDTWLGQVLDLPQHALDYYTGNTVMTDADGNPVQGGYAPTPGPKAKVKPTGPTGPTAQTFDAVPVNNPVRALPPAGPQVINVAPEGALRVRTKPPYRRRLTGYRELPQGQSTTALPTLNQQGLNSVNYRTSGTMPATIQSGSVPSTLRPGQPPATTPRGGVPTIIPRGGVPTTIPGVSGFRSTTVPGAGITGSPVNAPFTRVSDFNAPKFTVQSIWNGIKSGFRQNRDLSGMTDDFIAATTRRRMVDPSIGAGIDNLLKGGIKDNSIYTGEGFDMWDASPDYSKWLPEDSPLAKTDIGSPKPGLVNATDVQLDPVADPELNMSLAGTADPVIGDATYRRNRDFMPGVMRTAGILGTFLDNFANRRAINKMQGPAAPVYTPGIRMNTNYDINPQLNEARDAETVLNRGIDNTMTSAGSATAGKIGAYAQRLRNTGELYSRKTNAENQMRNHETMINANINANNIATGNAYRQSKVDFNNARTQAIAANSSNYGQDLMDISSDYQRNVVSPRQELEVLRPWLNKFELMDKYYSAWAEKNGIKFKDNE